MTTYTLRPNATTSGSAGYAATGGATMHAVLSDASDSSYVRRATNNSDKTLRVALPSPSLAAGEALAHAVFSFRSRRPIADSATWPATAKLLAQRSGIAVFEAAATLQLSSTTTKTSIATIPATYIAGGLAGCPVDIYDAHAYTDANRIYAYDTWLTVYALAAPTTTITAPTVDVTDSSRPMIEASVQTVGEAWQIADAPLAYSVSCLLEARVFTVAAASAPGFDPDVDVPEWSGTAVFTRATGTTVTATESIQVTDPLDGTTAYRAYVRASRTIDGVGEHWGAWDTQDFQMDLETAAAPTVTATADTANGRVQIEVDAPIPVGHTARLITIQSSTGGAWSTLADRVASSAQVYDFDDYIAPRGVEVTYRARVETTTSGEQRVGPWSVVDTATMPVDGWWLKVPSDPSLNIGHAAITLGDETRFVDVGIHRPIDSEYAVVVSGLPGGWDGSLLIRGRDASDIADIEALLGYDGPVYIEEPWGESRWVRLVDMKRQRGGFTGAPRTLFPVSYVEVEAP